MYFDVTNVTLVTFIEQVLHKKLYIDFFYNHILVIDIFNETLQQLIAQHGGNKSALARALDNVVTSNYLSMLASKKRGVRPSAELVEKIKEKFGVDPMTGKKIVTTVTEDIKKASELERLVSAFESLVQTFNRAMESKDKQVESLENDKKMSFEREYWLRQHIDSLTMRFDSLKQAQ